MKPAHARPVLGVISCNRVVDDGQAAQAVMTRYLQASMQYGDTAALLIPALPGLMQAHEIVARLDGVLLTGTPSNVEPKRYGEAAEKGEGPFDPERDEMMLRLVEAMLERGKPVFGICRGFQEINVAFGGTLRRDVGAHPELTPHHGPDDQSFDKFFDHQHPVQLVRDGVLQRALGRDELDVVSVHYQGADRLGAGLKVEATAPDGVVEAFSAEVNGAPVLAVQWHPEWEAQNYPDRQAFFALLGRALRREALV